MLSHQNQLPSGIEPKLFRHNSNLILYVRILYGNVDSIKGASMLSRTATLSHYGATPHRISIETDMHAGLPGITIVGLPSKAIDESRERIRSAIRNCDLQFPPRKVTINLAPADIAKTGTNFDLAIAVGILAASQQIPPIDQSMCFVGELALDGRLRPTRDSLASILSAERAGFTTIVIDPETTINFDLGPGITILRPESLRQLYDHFIGQTLLPAWQTKPVKDQNYSVKHNHLDEISGLETAKRIIEISAAGQHNVLLIGPPGVGKTLLVHALTGIMPAANLAESQDIHYIHSLANVKPPEVGVRPFRAPHHSTSQHALIGGGTHPRPGEASLAHHGVLFLDELPEYPRASLEALRQPIEDGYVTISRAAQSSDFPCDFTLIAAMNPCPCGYYGSITHNCICPPGRVLSYQQKISGPLLDRFDLSTTIQPNDSTRLSAKDVNITTYSSHKAIVNRINTAVKSQATRFKLKSYDRNSRIPIGDLKDTIKLDEPAKHLYKTMQQNIYMNKRSLHRILRVARTIADLSDSDMVSPSHLSEAQSYKQAGLAVHQMSQPAAARPTTV